MSIDWIPLADLIVMHDRFLVTTHVRPDGDALGSEVGMAGLLRQKGKGRPRRQRRAGLRRGTTSSTPPEPCSSISGRRSIRPSWPTARWR